MGDEWIEVTGQFNAIVPVPISVSTDIINSLNRHGSPPGQLAFSISASKVEVSLGDQTEPAFPEDGEMPQIKSFLVRITRHVAVQTDAAELETLSRDDEAKFEEIFIKAVKRVVSAIKKRTEQSSIDTRRPVRAYCYKYHRDDGAVVNTEFPLGPESSRTPGYVVDGLPGMRTHIKCSKELNKAMWDDLKGEVNASDKLPLHDELIYDAKALQGSMRYEQAALSAAIAVELMLGEIFSILLRRAGSLRDTEIKTRLAREDFHSLPRTIKKLDPRTPICIEEIDSVREERNAIAHGDSRDISPKRMAEIINTSYEVRRILDDYERLPETS